MLSGKWYIGDENLADAHSIRRCVFIEEQGIDPAIEMDADDAFALHLVIYDEEIPVATARMLTEYTDDGNEAVIGRVAVPKDLRGKKYGDFVMRVMIRTAFDMGFKRQIVHSQTAVRGFYERLGFTPEGDEYMEAGIPHITMVHIGDIG